MPRPNILWFSIEDTGPRFGCYGDKVARTPNLDRIAAEGCRYPNAFSVAGVCAPSRCAIITGMYPTFVGAHHMRTTHFNRKTPGTPPPYSCVLPHYVRMFTEYLRADGYFCTNNEKTDYQFEPPFTGWDEHSSTAHWRQRKPGQPFFSVFNPTMTHESGMWNTENLVTDPKDVVVPPFLPDTPETRRTIAKHYDNLAEADKRLGELLRELEADGLLKDTIIVVWSDHSEGLPRAKRWPYDSGIRIPLLVRWPGGIAPGSVDERLVSLIDLPPSMLSICNLPIPLHLQGSAFLGDQAAPPRDYIFATRDRHDESYDMVRAVRDARFKYIRNFRPDQPYQPWIPYSYKHGAMKEIWRLHLEGKLEGPAARLMEQTRPPEELYDVKADPHEIKNLAGDPRFAADLKRLRGVMDNWRREYDVYGDVPEIEMVRRWYPDFEQPVTQPPKYLVVSAESHAQGPVGGGTFKGPVLVQFHTPTQGASMGWTTESGDKPRWQLYTGPIRFERGTRVTLRAKAARIGYGPSSETVAYFVIE